MPQIAAKKNSTNNLNIFLNANFNIFIVIFVIGFLILGYYLVIKPKFDITLMSIRDTIAQQESFYQSQRQKLADLQAAAALYRKIDAEDVARVNAILPDEYAKEKLFGELEDIVMQRGLTLASLSLTKAGESEETDNPMAAKADRFLNMPGSERVGVISAQMSLGSTDYAALKNLLPLLEQHLQLMDIKVVNFDPSGKTADLTIDTYYFK
ncbi:hypothetical protein CVU83_02795 [Candidatus Falkowbacteria bacterium HGW-Falkowbacteria-2]|uniref:Pilus assembly protein PilO n=1 Tax=Candidatus Falkowbacteria bacterium HGW-Falkowbacteria-2 TaxID=2013769 RepID=A0A2N2DYT8_9BACT|nr:MAG: hypothetical protein CVU83_02795 [Candidatus Falkowbacteria bacterium HGW-Falkowbacteria-2]